METLNIASSYLSVSEIRSAWEEIKQHQPAIRIREAAQLLNLSEAQLLATTIGEQCIRLEGNWGEFIKRWKTLGEVMSLTRNEACVLEHKGTFDEINIFGSGLHQMATVIGPIETRVFLKNWAVAFAVEREVRGKMLTSIQVFDYAGHAITKIYLQKKSNTHAYQQLVADFTSNNQSPEQAVLPEQQTIYSEAVHKEEFLKKWANLKDTHAFFPLLRSYNIARNHAVQLAEGRFTQRISAESIQSLLENCAALEIPIMIFAGNHGNLQIHQDRVNKIVYMERGKHFTKNG